MDLEALDNALKASWQSVAMNMNMVRLLLITHASSMLLNIVIAI